MNYIQISGIKIEFDQEKTQQFYQKQKGFTCTCPDCINYVQNIHNVHSLLNGLDLQLGIDLTKDVGQEMDELMANETAESLQYVIPYYIYGKCYVDNQELEPQTSGPIWPNTKRAEIKLNEQISILIINITGDLTSFGNENVLTVWVEYLHKI